MRFFHKEISELDYCSFFHYMLYLKYFTKQAEMLEVIFLRGDTPQKINLVDGLGDLYSKYKNLKQIKTPETNTSYAVDFSK